MRFLHAGAIMGALIIALHAPMAVAAHLTTYAAPNGTRAALARIASERRSQATTVGHFDEPYGLTTDQHGNLFVANVYGKDTVVEVSSALVLRENVLGSTVPAAISIAVDNQENLYVGSEYGYINEFNSSGGPLQQITTNAGFPSSIAVDEYQDVYIVSNGVLAVDDPIGRSIYSNLKSSASFESVALCGPNVVGLAVEQQFISDGSIVLRQGLLTSESGLPGSAPVGAACANNGVLWFVDSNTDQLKMWQLGLMKSIQLAYLPAGVAYDAIHDRLFVADPAHNAVQMYTASTLAFVETIR